MDVGCRIVGSILPEEFSEESSSSPLEPEYVRPARGWHRGWITIQRIVLRDEGRPLLELVKDKNPARARGRG